MGNLDIRKVCQSRKTVTTKAGCLTLIQQIKEYQVMEETFSPTSAFRCSTDWGAPQPASFLGSSLTMYFVFLGWGSNCQVFLGILFLPES